jgi:hypothetical protein
MSRGKRIILFVALAGVILPAAFLGLRSDAESLLPSAEAHRHAATYPDYSGAVLPPNIAPLNLRILEPGRKFCLRLSARAGAQIEVFSSDGKMRIGAAAWRSLLEANAGGEFSMDIYVKSEAGWMHFDKVLNRIAKEAIDPYVAYRYIPPIFNKWDQISLRQRDLRGFDERVIVDNQQSLAPDGKTAGSMCVHCHTFLNHRTDQMLVHTRPARKGVQIPAMVLVRDGRAEKVDTRDGPNTAAAYTTWHPGGKLLAFSRNSFTQIFHSAGVETREVVDKNSDLGLYRTDTNEVFTVPQISRPDRLETWPSWSPDGRYLYFCSAPLWTDQKNAPLLHDKVRYDLERIAYDPASGRWGQVETVVAAAQLGRSISLPQISPDGRFLMFTGHDYGSFPIFQPSSDLYLLELSGGVPRRLDEINSDRSDSYHSWSSNSRWVIFASKREDGLFARLYIAYMEAGGRFGKPFVMPQEDPDFYGRCLMTYNRPELLSEAVTVPASELVRAMNSTALRPIGAAPPAGGAPAATSEPWQH